MNGDHSSRRDFLKAGAGALGSVALAGTSPNTARGEPLPAKAAVDNVILIVSDSFRRDAMSLYGANWIQTPNLDRFAGQAVVFDNPLVSSFPTVLARNDMLTGRHTFTYKGWQPIFKEDVTLPTILKGAGILTSLVADTPTPYSPGFNYQRDFDVWQFTRGQIVDPYRSAPRDVKLPCSPHKLRGGKDELTQYLRNMAHRHNEDEYLSAQTMAKAAEWLEENNDGRRFFLHVDTFDPHEPWDPPSYYVERYDSGYEGEEVIYPQYDFWRNIITERELKHCRALYAGEVTMVDRWAGFLLDRIASLGLLRNTAVIFVSDHGYYIGEHGYIGKALILNGFYQDMPLYPNLTHIPMLIYFPGCQGGSHVKALVQPVDLMPTILELLGVAVPPQVESTSLVPLLEGRATKVKDIAISSPAIYYTVLPAWETERVPPSPDSRSSITDGKWLLIYGPNPENAMGVPRIRAVADTQGKIGPELYNLEEDPQCQKNLVGENQGVARDLRSAYMEFLQKHKVPADHLQHFKSI